MARNAAEEIEAKLRLKIDPRDAPIVKDDDDRPSFGDLMEAYGELLGRYRDAIYFLLLNMVNNPSDAEDLTIEAFG